MGLAVAVALRYIKNAELITRSSILAKSNTNAATMQDSNGQKVPGTSTSIPALVCMMSWFLLARGADPVGRTASATWKETKIAKLS
jgi:hypothetical protein